MEIGRNDSGVIVGLADAPKLPEDLPNKIRDLLGILVAVNLHHADGKAWLVIEVDPYPNPISYRGHYYMRSGSTLQELKRAALLLFHADPERFVTGAFVKIGYFRSASDLAYHDEVHGNLFEQTAQTIDLVRTKYLKAAITYQGIQRIERYPVPNAALREAILNALVHRDYAVGAPVQIRVYENRLKIWNPAVLPEGWTLEHLLADHASSPYNPFLANAFFRAGEHRMRQHRGSLPQAARRARRAQRARQIETWGRGIQRIFEACREAGVPEPIIEYKPNDLWIEFPFSPEYLKTIAPTSSAQGGAQSGARSEAQSRPESRPESRLDSPLAVKVMELLLEANAGKAQLAKQLGHKSVSGELKKQITNLLTLEFIEMTLPDIPNSRLQKYRLTDLGRDQFKKT